MYQNELEIKCHTQLFLLCYREYEDIIKDALYSIFGQICIHDSVCSVHRMTKIELTVTGQNLFWGVHAVT